MESVLNILLITTDQHRFDALGYMGHPDIKTPQLDRLAKQGMIFERVYVTNPVCMPSRATLLTGQFPDAHGVRRNGTIVPDQPWGIARVLSRHGWRTGMFGKTHFFPLRRDYRTEALFHNWRAGEQYYGFQERALTHDLKDFVSVVPTHYTTSEAQSELVRMYALDDYVDWIKQQHPELYALALRDGLPENQHASAPELWTSHLPVASHQSTWITEQTMAFIERHHQERFFAWCSFVDPHHPFNAPRAYRDLYDPAVLTEPVWHEGELESRSHYHRERHQEQWKTWRTHWREYRAQYYGMISLIDEQIGRLMRHLEDLRLLDNTVVIFTSDHGEMLGDHGLSRKGLFHYEPLIRIPLLLYAPGHVVGGLRQQGIVQSVDIPATILDLVGIPLPEEYQGLSLAAWCRGERDDAPRSYALVTNGGEGPDYHPWPELRTLVTNRWKLQYYVNEGRVELDDLTQDPQELRPLDVEKHELLVRNLLATLVDAGSAASVWGPHVGRW